MGDITNKSTFESAEKWIETVRNNTSLRMSQPIPIVLAGNKCDLLDMKEYHEAEEWIK